MVAPLLAPALLPISRAYPSTKPTIATVALLSFIVSWVGGVLSPAFLIALLSKGHYGAAVGFATFIAAPYIIKPKVLRLWVALLIVTNVKFAPFIALHRT